MFSYGSPVLYTTEKDFLYLKINILPAALSLGMISTLKKMIMKYFNVQKSIVVYF